MPEQMTPKVVAAGDGFVRTDILRKALAEQGLVDNVVDIDNDWPLTPLVDIDGVHEANGDQDALVAALRGAQVLITHTQPVTERVLQASPDLRLVVICRGGPVNADIDAATAAGVMVTNTPGRNANATTEHSLGMILAATRQISQRDAELKAAQWRADYYQYDEVGPEIFGSTVGLVGYGAIGRRVTAALVAMGAQVLVFDPFLKETLPEGVELVDELDDLLRRSAILTIHARATADNAGLIGRRELALLPRGAVVVNCARPQLLDYDALADALASGHLYSAAADVLPSEPLPADHRLLQIPNLTVTPHLAGASKEAAWIAARTGAADIAAFVQGKKPTNLVNPEVWKG